MPRDPSLVETETAATRRVHAGRRGVAYPTMPPIQDTTVAHRKRTVPTEEELSDRLNKRPLATGDAEFRCEDCGARCTETPEGRELGHRPDCPERPAFLSDGSEGKVYGGEA